MSFLLAVLAQVGPFATLGLAPVSPLPPELLERRPPRPGEADAAPPDRLRACLADADVTPASAIDTAESWLESVTGSQRVAPGHCLGAALAKLERWDEAETAFLAARDAAAAIDTGLRARMGGMAGAAALAAGSAERALAALDVAHGDAVTAEDKRLAGDIQLDRARALVGLKQLDDAALALVEVRGADPGNAEAWLLSATLSRRIGKLADAQSQIETAAQLLPVDPEIGLEAGVIAMLAGREDAARKSWQSVVTAAPGSAAAATARNYLEQLDKP